MKIVIYHPITHLPFNIKTRGRVKIYIRPQLLTTVHEDICKPQPTRMRGHNTAVTVFETRKSENF
jgi:hypothetical protein